MSLAGFKKQVSKANQLFTEKLAGVKGTRLENDFQEMESKIDVCHKMIGEVVCKTQEYLQPNPNERAKMATIKTIDKIQGKPKTRIYTQAEGNLASAFLRFGRDFGPSTPFGGAMSAAGDAFQQLAENKYSLEDSVKQFFIEPFRHVLTVDIRTINKHRKKLESQRLDYDSKKRRSDKDIALRSPNQASKEAELQVAENKFEDSKTIAECSMIYFLESDTEHIQALGEFVNSTIAFHENSLKILRDLKCAIDDKKAESMSRQRTDVNEMRKSRLRCSMTEDALSENSFSTSPGPFSMKPQSPSAEMSTNNFIRKSAHEGNSLHQTPTARVLFDFTAEEEGELELKEGDVVKLLERIDDQWFHGTIKGKEGFFPISYVEILIPLPSDGLENKLKSNLDKSQSSSLSQQVCNTGDSDFTTSVSKYRAIHDFKHEAPDTLHFHENDIIDLIEKVNDHWYYGQCSGIKGYFPMRSVELITSEFNKIPFIPSK